MKSLENLKMMLEKEIEKITAKGTVVPGEIEMIYKVIDIIKDIDTIHAMEEYGDEEGYSSRGGPMRSYDSRGRRDYYDPYERHRMMGMDY